MDKIAKLKLSHRRSKSDSLFDSRSILDNENDSPPQSPPPEMDKFNGWPSSAAAIVTNNHNNNRTQISNAIKSTNPFLQWETFPDENKFITKQNEHQQQPTQLLILCDDVDEEEIVTEKMSQKLCVSPTVGKAKHVAAWFAYDNHASLSTTEFTLSPNHQHLHHLHNNNTNIGSESEDHLSDLWSTHSQVGSTASYKRESGGGGGWGNSSEWDDPDSNSLNCHRGTAPAEDILTNYSRTPDDGDFSTGDDQQYNNNYYHQQQHHQGRDSQSSARSPPASGNNNSKLNRLRTSIKDRLNKSGAYKKFSDTDDDQQQQHYHSEDFIHEVKSTHSLPSSPNLFRKRPSWSNFMKKN